jgi:hypothetical protein
VPGVQQRVAAPVDQLPHLDHPVADVRRHPFLRERFVRQRIVVELVQCLGATQGTAQFIQLHGVGSVLRIRSARSVPGDDAGAAADRPSCSRR